MSPLGFSNHLMHVSKRRDSVKQFDGLYTAITMDSTLSDGIRPSSGHSRCFKPDKLPSKYVSIKS